MCVSDSNFDSMTVFDKPGNKLRSISWRLLITVLLMSPTSFIQANTEHDPVSNEEHIAPVTLIENLHASLLNVMRAGTSIGFAERTELLMGTISSSYDFAYISNVVLGRYKKEISEQEKKLINNYLGRLSLIQYASQFKTFNGEQFKTVSTKNSRSGRVWVKTEIILPNKGPVNLNYLTHKTDEKWRIINVVANGVSELSIKRIEYNNFIKQNGIQEFIRKLDDNISELYDKQLGNRVN